MTNMKYVIAILVLVGNLAQATPEQDATIQTWMRANGISSVQKAQSKIKASGKGTTEVVSRARNEMDSEKRISARALLTACGIVRGDLGSYAAMKAKAVAYLATASDAETRIFNADWPVLLRLMESSPSWVDEDDDTYNITVRTPSPSLWKDWGFSKPPSDGYIRKLLRGIR